MSRLLFAIVAIAAGGCASPYMWTHPTKTQVDFRQDSLECELRSAEATAPIRSGIEAGMRQAEIHSLCMRSKGYERVRRPT